MASRVLRRLNKAQLLAALRRTTAAPFHTILWDSQPVQLGDAVSRLERAAEDDYFYATASQVFSGAYSGGPAAANPGGSVSANGIGLANPFGRSRAVVLGNR